MDGSRPYLSRKNSILREEKKKSGRENENERERGERERETIVKFMLYTLLYPKIWACALSIPS